MHVGYSRCSYAVTGCIFRVLLDRKEHQQHRLAPEHLVVSSGKYITKPARNYWAPGQLFM